MMKESNVKQIVERCQQGEREAFGELYSLSYAKLRNVCHRYISNEADIDDLLHDAFLLIFTKIGSLKDTSKAEAWMQKVVQNLSLAYLKQTHQQPVVGLEEVDDGAAISEMPSSFDYYEIMSHIDQLPESYQRVFRLSVLEGLGHQEIGELLNIEPHTSSADLFRAKKILRRSLAVFLLGLLAIGLPIALWQVLQQPSNPAAENVSNPTSVPSTTPEEPMLTASTDSVLRQDIPDSQPVRTKQRIVRQPVATDSPEEMIAGTTAPDTTEVHKELPSPTPQEAVTIVQTPDQPASTPDLLPVGGDLQSPTSQNWTLSLTFSGISSRQTFNLPYGEYGMNDPETDTITHHRLPLTIGLSVNKMLGNRWSIGTGLQYTQLYSETQAGNTFSWEQREQRLQYLGIPLKATWYPVRSNHWGVFTSAQTMLELPLHSTLQTSWYADGNMLDAVHEQLHPSVQWSIGLGIGLEYRLTPVIGFYVEPSLNYYFKTKDGLDTYRTAHPVTFSIPIGIRINIK